MKAIKGNKLYTIDEAMKPQYQKDGFDIYDDAGKLLENAIGKTIPYEEHLKILAEAKKKKSDA